MLQAVIFDMDGVLIDSEPFWQQAEIDILSKLGVPITLEDTYKTMGIRIDQLVGWWYQKHPWEGSSCTDVINAIVQRVCEQIASEGKSKPGLHEALEFCRSQDLPIGLATSSPTSCSPRFSIPLRSAATLLTATPQSMSDTVSPIRGSTCKPQNILMLTPSSV